MTHTLNFYLILPFLTFATGTAMAQPGNRALNNRNNTQAIAANTQKQSTAAPAQQVDANSTGISDTSTDVNGDVAFVAEFNTFPNPSKGMLTVKAGCAGKVYFYSQKGKEMGGCIVNEGTSVIYLQNVLNPGVYICRYEGANGSKAEVRITYEL